MLVYLTDLILSFYSDFARWNDIRQALREPDTMPQLKISVEAEQAAFEQEVQQIESQWSSDRQKHLKRQVTHDLGYTGCD